MSEPARPELCDGTVHEGTYYACGRTVLLRDPARQEEACPGGLAVCWDCTEEFSEFMRRAYDAAARRAEHRED